MRNLPCLVKYFDMWTYDSMGRVYKLAGLDDFPVFVLFFYGKFLVGFIAGKVQYMHVLFF